MRETDKELVSQIHDVLYVMLCDIDDYCGKNQITYFLSGGTALGAVRHKGFIPWDDDADIMLPRKDYERLILHFEEAYKGKYKVGSLYTDKEWQRPYARIWSLDTELVQTNINEQKMGILIDVFPIDGLPKQYVRQAWYFKKIKILNALRNATIRKAYFENEKHRMLKHLLGFVMRPFSARPFAERMDNLSRRYCFDTSKYVAASLAAHYGIRERIERKHMEQGIRVPFEQGELVIPIGYDTYLTNLYDDYMKIPENVEEIGYAHMRGWEIHFKK